MRLFTANLLLALGWVSLTAVLTASNLALGFALGYLILWLVREPLGETRYFTRVPNAAALAAFAFRETLLSSLRLTWDVLTPAHRMRPGIVAVEIGELTDLELSLLANLVTLTPGTLSLDLSEDRKTLYVHAMYAEDRESLRRAIERGYVRRVLGVLR